MRSSLSLIGFILLTPVIGGLSGCSLLSRAARNAQSTPPEPRVVVKVPAPGEAERIGSAGDEFNASLSQWSDQGHYREMLTAARLRLEKEPAHVGARYALAHALYYNGDFAAAVVEAQKLVQIPQYQNDSVAQELLDNARTLSSRYAGQKFAPVAWMPNEVEATSEKWRQHGATLIAAGQYDEIERTADQLTRKPEIMVDGGWTLAPFFVGLWNAEDGTEADWTQAHARTEAWAAARPKSQLAQVCLARSWTAGAWIARGDAFADAVPEATWTVVRTRQSNAKPILTKMLNAPQAFSPLVYASAQRYGRLGGAPRDWQDKVFERAIAQYPTYTDFHRERSALLLPRWDGASGEWEREAARVADAQTDVAAGDQLYARLVWSQWDYHKNMRQQTRVDWERTKRGFDALLMQYPGSLAASTMYVRLCHQWHDYPKAQQVLQIINGRADANSWRTPAHFAQTRNFLLRQS